MHEIDKQKPRNKRMYYWGRKIVLMLLVMVVLGGVYGMTDDVLARSLGGEVKHNLKIAQDSAGLPYYTEPVDMVVLVIQGLLGIIAVIFFILIIIAGFRWMTAGGNEETVAKSKKIISNALLGILVIMFAYAITMFIFTALLKDS